MKLRHVSTAFLVTCLLLLCNQGRAEVIATGDVDPSGATDPWEVDANLTVGDTGEGTLNIESGGVVSNGWGYIGDQEGSVGTATVTGEGSQWNNSHYLYVGRYGEGTLNIESGGVVTNTTGYLGDSSDSVGTATVTGEGSEWNNSNSLRVGQNGDGTLNIEGGGVVTNTTGYLGYYSDSVGTATVAGEGSKWNNSSRLYVGDDGTGTLNIESGGVVTNTTGYIGLITDSVGTVTVAGEGSEWNNADDLYVGYYGEGTLNIMAGGVVSSTAGWIGFSPSSVGTATVAGEGSEWNNSTDLSVGRYGEGTLNIADGGTVNVTGDTWVASSTGSSGLINFDNGTLNTGGLVSSFDNLQGTGTINTHGLVSDVNLIFDSPSSLSQSWTLDDPGQNISLNLEVDGTGSIGVGYEGTALLHISGGVKVESLHGYLGWKEGSSGTAFVVGEGSEWKNSGSLFVGNYGEGTLNIEDEGTVNVDGETWVAYKDVPPDVNNFSSGVINFDNGTLNTGGLISSLDDLRGTGTINTHGLVSDLDLIFDRPSSLSQTMMLDDPGQNITLNLEVDGTGSIGAGYEGTALHHISGRVKVESLHGYLGWKEGSSGTAFVVGEGSEWNSSGVLHVGLFGEGMLNITAGGVVSVGSWSTLGWQPGSIGTVTVSGEGSQWNNSSSLRVGDKGEGTLNIESGGVVTNTYGYLGYFPDSVGTATVTGEGSEWNNSGELYVGSSGKGTLNIADGGVVSNLTGGSIGSSSGSVGTVTVTGEGSEWNNSEELYVGRSGEGTLNIESGGVVSSRRGSIGYYSDSVGTVTVTGQGSLWNNSSNFTVGLYGEGTLNISDGGVVNVAGTTTLNNSTLHVELSDTTSGPSLITDRLNLGLGGTLEISLADGFVPELGSTFDILDFNTVSGSFAEMNLPVLEGGLEWDTSQLLVDGTLHIPLAGDFNNDGTIDAADFTVWQDNLGLSASALNGNGSGAATVVQADYLLWKTNFEALATGSEGAAAVPEPVTLLLALLALAAAPLRVRCG